MYKLAWSKKFEKSYKLAGKRGLPLEKLDTIIKKLVKDEPLEKKNKDHELSGNLKGVRECHITADWLLEYIKDKGILVLTLVDTGTHSDLFKK